MFKTFFEKGIFLRAVAGATVFCIALTVCGFNGSCERIRENVLRLHVLANSDSEIDQALKLKVRDAVLVASEQVFLGCQTEEEAAVSAENNLQTFKKVAEQVVKNEGYTYPVTVVLADTYFETRHYENFTLPAGEYRAVRVIIGEGEGKNWWCVMFPSICLPAANAKEDGFEKVLDDSETDIVSNPRQYKARFKIVEIFEGFRKSLSKWFG